MKIGGRKWGSYVPSGEWACIVPCATEYDFQRLAHDYQPNAVGLKIRAVSFCRVVGWICKGDYYLPAIIHNGKRLVLDDYVVVEIKSNHYPYYWDCDSPVGHEDDRVHSFYMDAMCLDVIEFWGYDTMRLVTAFADGMQDPKLKSPGRTRHREMFGVGGPLKGEETLHAISSLRGDHRVCIQDDEEDSYIR